MSNSSSQPPQITTNGESQRRIFLNAFIENTVQQEAYGMWQHPDDRSRNYKDMSHWIELAKILEDGLFDSAFIADLLGASDVYGGSVGPALKSAIFVPINDPIPIVAAMASVTKNLGFGMTAGVFNEHPYALARRMSTLDHLTQGRVAWNVVTGFMPSAARNMGFPDLQEHDSRYNYAEEYMEVAYKLWEGSWDEDAVVYNKETGVFVDPTKVRGIEHKGETFSVPGIHLSEPSPQRTPVIFQAGTSSRGMAFATKHAEMILTGAPTKEILKENVKNIREQLVKNGRDPYSARIVNMLTVITGPTSEAAQAKYEELKSYADLEGALVAASSFMGYDFSKVDLDQPVRDIESNAILSTVENFQKADPSGEEWTVRKLAEFMAIGSLGPHVVGSGEEIADHMQEWVTDTDVDGFNLCYHIMPGTYQDIAEHVIPVLQARGAYPTSYADGTLRNKLFGNGDRLPSSHVGSTYRDLSKD